MYVYKTINLKNRLIKNKLIRNRLIKIVIDTK